AGGGVCARLTGFMAAGPREEQTFRIVARPEGTQPIQHLRLEALGQPVWIGRGSRFADIAAAAERRERVVDLPDPGAVRFVVGWLIPHSVDAGTGGATDRQRRTDSIRHARRGSPPSEEDEVDSGKGTWRSGKGVSRHQ